MTHDLTNLADAICTLQIKLAALEFIVLHDEYPKAEYTKIIDEETKRVLANRIPEGAIC